MNVSKILIAALAVLVLSGQAALGHWVTSGGDIYNSNTGNVGIETSSPQSHLYLYKGTAGTAPAWPANDQLILEHSAGKRSIHP